MPVPWLVVLKSLPWTDVIKSAPKIAERAKKLWSSVDNEPPVGASADAEAGPAAGRTDTLQALEARLAATQAGMDELHRQMMESSRLIKELADQNAVLVERIEANRLRLVRLTIATAVLGLLAVGLAVVLLLR